MYQIMLVEDEMLVRESMAQNTNWDKFGFAPPHVFENGRQALEQLESVLPDVVITDICSPLSTGWSWRGTSMRDFRTRSSSC